MTPEKQPSPALSATQRRCHVLLMLYAPLTAVQLEIISEINGVGLSTTWEDLAEVTCEIQRIHHLDVLQYSEKECRIQGDQLAQRLCLFQGLRRTLRISPDFVSRHFIPWLHIAFDGQTCQKVALRNDILGVVIEDCSSLLPKALSQHDRQLMQICLQYCLWQNDRPTGLNFTEQQRRWLREKPEYAAAREIYVQLQSLSNGLLDDCECEFFTLILRMLKNHSYQSSGSTEDQRLLLEIENMVARFQEIAGMKFSSYEGLVGQLFAHLGPAIERCHFGIGIDNLMQEEVNRMYPRLVRTTREALKGFENEYLISLSEDEIGLVAITFGAWLMQGNALQEKQILLLTHDNPQLEEAVEQQLREATLLPLNIKYQTLADFYQFGAPGGVAMIVTPYAIRSTDADPLVIHTQLPLAKEQRKRIRSLLEAP
ncbi:MULTISPECIES: stationary phase inducible protein CsiE [Rahnella]|uniref:Stationary phase inducible protein CsiE n=1 Tax=Rahnella laticis TaxID=2787622 RepID=A0ABS0E9T6_9GAMM|nr:MULTISPECIES: stationary phase inducible protein CsiE [Rahnella]MBF7981529.1 stationary phase inducible protein CsiE [Rahnella laticis]MBF8001621.1 stationary phase inducible protein CsiE [Rahnella sp. LAC-M12]